LFMDITGDIQKKIKAGLFEYSKHAVDQSILRNITVGEVREAFNSTPELLEDYQDDFYGPSCLLLVFTANRRPIHVICSYPTRPLIKLITVYEPDPDEWVDFRKRI